MFVAVGWGLAGSTEGHAAVATPLPRKLDREVYCPWCVGEHQPVTNGFGRSNLSAVPSSPCMGTRRLGERYTSSAYSSYSAQASPGPTVLAPGTTLHAKIVIDADHNGLAHWSYCPHGIMAEDTEACFGRHRLTDWTDVHAYWGSPPSCGDHCKSGEVFEQSVPLPTDMPTGWVTLRWLWICKNTDEVFLSCIDIEVSRDSAGSGSIPISPTTGDTTSAIADTSQAAAGTSPGQVVDDATQPAGIGECASSWQRCGGDGWRGPECCASGWVCAVVNRWHSQCEDASDVLPTTAAPTMVPTTVPPGTHVAGQGPCSGSWQRCGGEGWGGPTCCAQGWVCEAVNIWHSQCEEVREHQPLSAASVAAAPHLQAAVELAAGALASGTLPPRMDARPVSGAGGPSRLRGRGVLSPARALLQTAVKVRAAVFQGGVADVHAGPRCFEGPAEEQIEF